MKAFQCFLAVVMALMMGVACNASGDDIARLASQADTINGYSYLIVDFEDDVTPQELSVIGEELGIDMVPNSDMYSKTKITRLTLSWDIESRLEEIVDDLEDSGLVEGIEVDQQWSLIAPPGKTGVSTYPIELTSWWRYSVEDDSYPNDPLYRDGKQWHMTMIGVEEAWKHNEGEGVVVAILDTGVSTGKGKFVRVPDLKQTCMVEGRNFTSDGAVDDPYDGNGHGTHVAGTVAQSTNNGIGVVGVAHKACLMPVKVLSDRGYGSTAGIAEAIRWATDHGADVINMSLGGGGYSKLMDSALDYAAEHNVFVACAAGNAGQSRIEYPAAMDGCQAVSSVGKSGNLAFYSSYGDNGSGVFVAAPGGDQQADGPEGGVWQNTIARGDPTRHGYFPFQGTSMATPHVAGAAALVIGELEEDYQLSQVKKALSSTAVGKDDRTRYGNGVLNAAHAVKVASTIEPADEELSWFGWVLVLVIGVGAFRAARLVRKRK